MKNALLFCFSIFNFVLNAQNVLPQISNISSNVDTTQKLVTITFDALDTENNNLDISLSISNNNGVSFEIDASNITGDIGFPVAPGNNKSIVWNYSNLTGMSGNYTLKIVADDRQTPSIADLVAQVDSILLKNDMQILEGNRNYLTGAAKLNETKDTIRERFTNLGLQTSTQNFTYTGFSAQNIIGKKQGHFQEGNVIIIDGHFDSVEDVPGADDNASAIIGVFEAARILSQYNFKKTINFIGFDLEELGLIGSKEYVNNGIKPYETIEGVLNFEMIGYYSNRKNSQSLPAGFNLLFPNAYNEVAADTFRGNFITNVANNNSASLMNAFKTNANLYVPQLRVVNVEAPGNSTMAPDLRRSDHAPFWDGGMKALMLTDGANFRNLNYHTVNDISDSLSFTFITNVVKATIATAADLAQLIHADIKTTSVNLPNVPVGIKKIKKVNDLKLSPNPADNKLTLNWEKAGIAIQNIKVMDLQGKIVYETNLTNAGINTHTIFTEVFASGTYILNLSGNDVNISEKFIVKH